MDTWIKLPHKHAPRLALLNRLDGGMAVYRKVATGEAWAGTPPNFEENAYEYTGYTVAFWRQLWTDVNETFPE